MAQYEQVKFASISVASSGANTVVAAVTAKKIRVLAYSIVATGAVTAQWKSAAAGANLSGAMSLAANGGLAPTGDPTCPLFETAAGELLNLNLGGAVQVSGHVTYQEIT